MADVTTIIENISMFIDNYDYTSLKDIVQKNVLEGIDLGEWGIEASTQCVCQKINDIDSDVLERLKNGKLSTAIALVIFNLPAELRIEAIEQLLNNSSEIMPIPFLKKFVELKQDQILNNVLTSMGRDDFEHLINIISNAPGIFKNPKSECGVIITISKTKKVVSEKQKKFLLDILEQVDDYSIYHKNCPGCKKIKQKLSTILRIYKQIKTWS